VLLAAGCASDQPQDARAPASDTRQAALTVLDSLRQDVFRGAFGNLKSYTFTRRLRTVQLGVDGGAPSARRSRVIRYGYRGGERTVRVERADSSGAFDLGWLGNFADRGDLRADVENMGRQIIDEEPPYLARRSRESFRYRLVGDTLLGGRSARIVAIEPRPSAAGEQAVKRARLYVDRATDQLVGVRLKRQSRSLLLDETSRLRVFLQPTYIDGPLHKTKSTPNGRLHMNRAQQRVNTAWVPASTRFTTRLDVPVLDERAFRTSSSFTSYAARRSTRSK
jgi:hypothetical protein